MTSLLRFRNALFLALLVNAVLLGEDFLHQRSLRLSCAGGYRQIALGSSKADALTKLKQNGIECEERAWLREGCVFEDPWRIYFLKLDQGGMVYKKSAYTKPFARNHWGAD